MDGFRADGGMRGGGFLRFRLDIQEEFPVFSSSLQPIGFGTGYEVRDGGVGREMKVFLEILLEDHDGNHGLQVVDGGDRRRGGFQGLVDDLLRGETLIRFGRFLDGGNNGESDRSHVDATGLSRATGGRKKEARRVSDG